MKRLNLLFLLLLICLLSCALLDVEAKSKEKSKEKNSKKYKTEGSPKEVKHRYSKQSQKSEEYSQRKTNEKEQEETLEPNNDEVEAEEIVTKSESVQKPQKQKKGKKPYTISVELVEESVPEIKTRKDAKKSNKVSSEDNIDAKVQSESKQKGTKRQGTQAGKKSQTSNSVADDTADFIVHVPKNKKGTRQVLVFQVPAQDNEENEEGEIENAVQQYINEEEDPTVEEDCGCEENTAQEQSIHDKKSSNDMCYY